MRLESLAVRQVRNLTDIQITPNAEMNIIYGENAAGKTAILESIYLLSKARSFRTSHIKEVIQHRQQNLMVSATLHEDGDTNKPVNTGIRKSSSETEIKYKGERVMTVSQQARNVVIQTVNPDDVRLLTGSPKDRRKWIDWALFHVEQDYLQTWHSYHLSLRNRNALLRRSAKDEEFFIWEKTMETAAKRLGEMWENYLVCLQRYYQAIAGEYFCGEVVFGLKQDKVKPLEFLEYLQTTRRSDMKMGFTQQGPHKVDFEFKSQDKHVNTVFSRGQIKFFVAMLSIAQAKVLKGEKDVVPIVLADDLTAELDKKTVITILELLCKDKMQLFITTTEPNNTLRTDKGGTLFHVKHGRVKRC